MKFLGVMTVILCIAAGLAWAGSDGGARWQGLPVFAVCVALAFVIQWLAFIPAYLRQTEHFYDLTGSLTYLSVVALALGLGAPNDTRAVIIALLVVVWACRLGTFLFSRIRSDGSDGRFDKIKPDPKRFFITWSLQGLWVGFTAASALAAISSAVVAPLGLWFYAGLVLWLLGFAVEVVADWQKRAFRAKHGSGQFIQSGLWALSRHPNYFGEIVLWVGISVMAVPVLSGWQYVTLLSPVFVFFLLTRVSGIPLLRARNDKRWGHEPDYQAYVARTPVLVPFIGRRSR